MEDSASVDGQAAIAERPAVEHQSAKSVRPATGVWLGVVSAVGYTCANMALRNLAGNGDVPWAIGVSFIKAIPAAAVAWVVIAYRASRGLPALPTRDLLVPLIGAGLIMQFAGNVMFQCSLALGGLAITVPLCFATLITTGALLGRFLVGDLLTPRTATAVALLLGSIVFLSSGAGNAARAMSTDASTSRVALAVLTACVSGVGYGTGGVVIRRLVTTRLSLSATLVVFSTTGVVVLGLAAALLLDAERIAAITSGQWWSMSLAGWFNAIAFFAVGGALRHLNVNQVNVVNASQNAMCAIAGVMLFHEPASTAMILGCGLTIVGLLIMNSDRRPTR